MSQKLLSKALLLYVIFISHLTSSKKLRSPGIDDFIDKTLNECGRCKLLTDSFNHWIDKTSRGKFEGGDAAWEETKLKSYARSEIRLVEIQEGLCSELKKHQDYCYALSEEAEQIIEKWWLNDDPNSIDIYTWLCIDTKKYCCPVNHFGNKCTSCPLVNDKICNDNGKCDGEGTRQGNGTCICNRGYSGKNCEQCSKNFYSSSEATCKQCHRSCSDCSGEGPSACHACRSGWRLESGVCIDIDECLFESSCKPNEICVNREGSFRCKTCHNSCKTCSGIDAKNCTSCEPSNVLWGGMCITRKQHNDILFSTIKKFVIYTGLTIIATYIHIRYFRSVLYIYFIILGILIYYLEPAQMHLLEVIQNIYLSSSFYVTINNLIKSLAKVFEKSI